MFGPYVIESKGLRYFCNVSLCECHTFEYDGNTYIVDVQKMAAHTITAKLAAVIGRLRSDPSLLIPEAVMETLRRLGLVTGEEETPPDTATPAASDTAIHTASGKPEFPVTNIGLFLAQECNMRCVYCYGDAGTYGGGGLMDEATALRAVDWLIAHSGSVKRLSLGFFGGEPLLNFPLMRVVVPYAKQEAAKAGKTIFISITTNGSLLTDEVIAFIRDEDIKVLISFDGPPEIQNHQRPFKDGSGSYDSVKANIGKLRQCLPYVLARATLCDGIDPLLVKKGLKQVGFTSYTIAPVSPAMVHGPGKVAPENDLGKFRHEQMLAFHRHEADELLAAIREQALKKDSLPGALEALGALLTKEKRHYGCGIGKNMAGITVNGDVYPCHRFAGLTEICQGNIAEYKPGEPSDYHWNVVDNLPECRDCWVRYCCGGGCFYHSMAVTGDMRRPDPQVCRDRQTMFEGLVHVYCQLGEDDRTYARGMLRDCGRTTT